MKPIVLWPRRQRRHVPPFPSRRLRWWRLQLRRALLAAAVIASAVGVVTFAPRCAYHVVSHPFFAVRHFEIEGNERLAQEEVLDWLGAKPGMSAWLVDPVVWRARLLAHPWVQAAAVRRELPRRVRIRLRERRPFAVVRWRDTFALVDRTGHFLGPAGPVFAAHLPLLTLPASGASLPQEELRLGLRFLRLCARLGCAAEVSEVLAGKDGITVYPLRSRTEVALGRGSWREKLLRASRVFAAWEEDADRLERVDVSYRRVVVVRVREQPNGQRKAPARSSRKRQSV